MLSDRRVLDALRILDAPIARFRGAVAASVEEIRTVLAGSLNGTDRAERLRAQFGPFADGRVDMRRLSAVLAGERGLDMAARKRLEMACETLEEVAAHGSNLLCVQVPPGTPVAGAISAQLSAVGRAFGAARVAAVARGLNAVVGASDEHAMARLPFAEWTTAERRLAPPLIVTATGRDLDVSALAPFLDGALKIVLIVDGPCAPAPLVRLITPNLFVMQVHAVEELGSIATWPAAAITALMPPNAARFVHDPAGGPEPWQRLRVVYSPDTHLARLGGLTAAQQREEVLQLDALATRPSSAIVAPSPAAPSQDASGDPIDRLAAWLLRQADLPGVEAK